ncbi:tetratricopeptide repeat protein [Rhodoblastus sp.]|uniref:tetratricopeptide repeat protein n=1 Tax=Rhodoblastus sp. TaxID=1962975 RepID=UPI003F945221
MRAFASVLFVLLACGAARAQIGDLPSRIGPPDAQFVGSASCAACHRTESDDWHGSHHAAAIQAANDKSVLGKFDGAIFRKGGEESRFFRRDGKFFVHTAGPDGKQKDFEFKYTFGLYPLQQYLIALPGGRLQAFGVAWDSRPAAQGGQKWFDLYPDRKLAPGDPLHWTGIDQNWNYQCAWCHSTDLRKHYDPAKNSFATHWSEISVGCEACHGPGSRHLAWARKDAGVSGEEKENHGFSVRLDQRADAKWRLDATTAFRSPPATRHTEELVCAGCHARRGQFSDAPLDALHFYDAFRAATLDRGLYYPDGQQHDEDYNFASFAQSRMHAAGVTCSDCHNPHSGKLRLPGNQVCGQCHDAKTFDAPSHHHHPVDSTGAQCASCHMPTTIYMGVDARHDHSIRIPRPDRTVALGTPNACNQCHQDKDAAWAVAALKSWHGKGNPGAQTFAEAFALADSDGPGARAALIAVAQDESQSFIARASALHRLMQFVSPDVLELAERLTKSGEPMIRTASAELFADADPATRARALAPLLRDQSRVVRMQAARELAGASEKALSPDDLAPFDNALAEYVAGEMFNAERPESRSNLGLLELARGHVEAARSQFEMARKLDRTFAPAPIMLAEIARGRGGETAAETILSKALSDQPLSAPLAHALGLNLVRQKRLAEAMPRLEQAARLAPEDPHYAYVYAVALHDTGSPDKAVEILRAALARHANDRDLLSALASYEAQTGDFAAALGHAQKLMTLEPDDAELRKFADQLKARVGEPMK